MDTDSDERDSDTPDGDTPDPDTPDPGTPVRDEHRAATGQEPPNAGAAGRVPGGSDVPLSTRAGSMPSSFIRDVLSVVSQPGIVSLAGGLPDESMIPTGRLAEAANRVIARQGAAALQYAPTEGVPALREVLADRLGLDAASILVTTGSQQAIDLLARSVCDPGDIVIVESPSYLGTIQAYRAAGADVRCVRGDAEGLDTDALEAVLDAGLRPRLVSVVGQFANPTGATLSARRRRHLVALAARFGFVVVDDDPYGELRWAGERPPSLHECAAAIGAERFVVSIGSSSKILAPGLRVGWMVAAEPLRSAAVRFKQSADLHTGSLDQWIVADVLSDAAFVGAHLDAARELYRHRCGVLVEELSNEFAGLLEMNAPEGGMFLWARCTDENVDTTEWFHRSVQAGVAFVPGAAFSVDSAWNSALRMCFATVDDASLVEAVRRMTRGYRLARRANGPFGA